MLKTSFNRLTSIHSRGASLRRYSNTESYIQTTIRITPSNYFSFMASLSSTTFNAREFIIPVDTMLGYPVEKIVITGTLTDGTLKLGNTAGDTADIAFDSSLATVQTLLRAIPGYENVVVTGTDLSEFYIEFLGVQAPLLLDITDNQLVGFTDFVSHFPDSHSQWSPRIKRGDQIIDTVYSVLSVEDIIDIPDVGGDIMGFRVRCS